MYSYIWIEDEKNLNEFCLKRFGETPKFADNIGRITGNGESAKVHKIYKDDADGNYHQMYFLWMSHERGRYGNSEINEIKRWNYEKIKTDRTAILRKLR
ncbi:MAG: hypothetical protein K2J29_00775 [Muribaculaceae bacterium]|nr:hypothetical protein [Muribaculaceae bacterium]